MSRAAPLDCQHLRSCALVLTLFLFQKGQGFFPPLPIAALLRRSRRRASLPLAGWRVFLYLTTFPRKETKASAPPQSAWGILTPCKVGCFDVAGRFCGADKQAGFLLPAVGGGHTYPLRGGMVPRSLFIFATQKASVILISRWPFTLHHF